MAYRSNKQLILNKKRAITPTIPKTILKATINNIDPSVPFLIKAGLIQGAELSSTGALIALSGLKTGRSPKDKRIVKNNETKDIWWGPNIGMSEALFEAYKSRAIGLIRNYEINGFAGWDEENNIKIKLYTNLAYHALFMKNLLVPCSSQKYSQEFIIYDAGEINLPDIPPNLKDFTLTTTLIALNLSTNEAVIFGTKYAGEIKKLVFTLLMYLMPLKNNLPLHSSANISPEGSVSLFFGLSGSGKTSLSSTHERKLIGDDEHVWTDNGIFNIEGGCYAKCINLSENSEPQIYNAIKFGSVLENVIAPEGIVDYDSTKITENTRCAYPLSFINSIIPAKVNSHPDNIILLVCDTFGLLPPVAKLSIEQAIFFFISGYTSKIAGTEVGIKTPEAVFSSCFAEPFIVWKPAKYGELLRRYIEKYKSNVWLLNTGWIKGPYGKGERISIETSRWFLDQIHSNSFDNFYNFPLFDISVPVYDSAWEVEDIFTPRNLWENKEDYDTKLQDLFDKFNKNYKDKLKGISGSFSG